MIRMIFSLIAIAINILVFTTLFAFLIGQIRENKIQVISTVFFTIMEMGIVLNTVLICTAR